MGSHQEIVERMFEAMSSGLPFQQQWEGDIRRLGKVDVIYIEGRTLLQHAVIQGMLDWVQALVASGTDLSGDSGKTSLELARQKATQHSEDWQRKAIKAVLEVTVARERMERQDGGVISEERSPSVPHILNLQWLEDFLGVKLETCGERVKLPADVLQRLKETVDQDGNSLLMRAAKEGSFKCVDLLLRCGAQVNASRTIDGEEQRAIDFAVERGYNSIVKLLLQLDSLTPHEEDPEDWLKSLAREDTDIEDLLKRRDIFHEKVKEGDEDGIREMVLSGQGNDDSCGHPRYWVNRKVRSALLTAARDGKPSVLALLKRLNFVCLENEERKLECELEVDENKRREYNSALIHKLERIKYRHVLMMTLNSFMREGEVEHDGGDFIRQVYVAADKVREARVLMQCLQYEQDFEVIFDNKQKDISCMYIPSGPGVPGVYDPSVHRVYASAALDSWSDTVSNLVHELAHAVMRVVFDNDGLPYSKGDQEREMKYSQIVSTISSEENIKNCNIIIQRVIDCYSKKLHPHEFIVRVPEIITKLKLEGDDGESIEPWKNDHEKELFNFYSECVEKDIISWIENRSKEKAFAFLSRHVREIIGVGMIEEPRPINHNGIHYLQVSNLALGVSHLKKSLEGILCVDWGKFLKKKKPLEINLMRRNISHMAVVWDERMGNQFCEQSETCSEDCPAYKFSSIKEYVTFIVPKSFKIPEGEHPLEYEWEHLSKETKNWILGRGVAFQGKDVTLKELIDIVAEGSDVESIMSSITDSDDIALLIEEHKISFGSKLKSMWGMRGDNFAKNHPEICIERTMEMREIDLKGEIARGRDAFFFTNAEESDLRKINAGTVSYWNSENVPVGTNCFLLKEHLEKEMCDRICKQVRLSEKKWPLAHFFRFSRGKYIYVQSKCISGNRCRILADEPGCGKTVYVYDAAMKEKENHPEIWTEVVELSKCEKVLERWNENNSEGNVSVEDFLYDLITVYVTKSQPGYMTIVSKLFKHFCRAKEKVSIYFDGFDEICPKYENKCSSFLKHLREKLKVNMLVTSRTNEMKHLEENLCKFTIHLVPFNEKEQISFLNEAWNSQLKSLEESKRADKVRSLISNVRARSGSENIFCKAIENLTRHSEDPSVEVDFTEVAEKVIEMFKSSVEGEGYLSGVPLHAWMIATVYFEDNFRTTKSLELSHLYTRFVTAKLKEYCSAKHIFTGRQLEDIVWRITIKCMRQNLKRFSASFFLKNQTYLPKAEYLSALVRAGLLIEKSGSFDFTHRTFGELFFSIWILEKAKDPDVTRILLESVLLDDNFKKVREFIDEILLSSEKNTSANGEDCICEISEPSKSAFDDDEELSILFCKCFHRAVSSCHRGIIKYLAKSGKERLADALFSRGVCNCGAEKYNDRNEEHNAFCLKESYILESRDLETIHTLLILTEQNDLVEKFRDFISECGLEWVGINEEILWRNEECRTIQLRIIHFFSKHDIFREEIGDKIFRKYHLNFLKYFSFYSFNEWKSFLNTILGENWLRKLLVPSSGDDSSPIYSPMTEIWCFTVRQGSLENVSEMWEWIKSNLETEEVRKEFLLRKDEDGRNYFFSSIFDNDNYQVLKFVWEQVESHFKREELKEFIFESFESKEFLFYKFSYKTAKNMTNWLSHVTVENVINLNDAMVLFRKIPVNKFTIGGWFPVQDFLMAAGGDEQARGEVEKFLVEGEIWGFEWEKFTTFDDYYSSEFRSFVRREWERILPLLSPHLPTRPIPLYGDGCVRKQSELYNVHITTMVAYLVFSWRQFGLMSKYLTSSDLMQGALKNYFSGILHSITYFLGSESIPFVFSVVTAFFSKDQIHEAFQESNFPQMIADLKTEKREYVSQFLAACDFARLVLGEDALWVVHSISRGGQNDSLVDVLLQKQEEGIFESFFSEREDFLRKNPLRRLVDLRSLEFREEWPYFRMSNESDNGSESLSEDEDEDEEKMRMTTIVSTRVSA